MLVSDKLTGKTDNAAWNYDGNDGCKIVCNITRPNTGALEKDRGAFTPQAMEAIADL